MKQILIVDDSKAEIQKIKQYLADCEFTIRGVSSAEEAEVRLKIGEPDLIILDVMLPGRSGSELCRQLKQNSKTSSIPIIIYSAKDSQLDRNFAKLNGADACISKAIDREILIEIVNQFIK
jgi:two-component system, chemotaxis family, response regulator PixH